MSTPQQKNMGDKIDDSSPSTTADVVEDKQQQQQRPQITKSNSMKLNSTKSKIAKFNANVQNSFSADSPYFLSYVENEMNSMQIMHQTLNDIAARTKTFGKCGSLMAESTRRLALACQLRQPQTEEDDGLGVESEENRRQEMQIAERKRAVGGEMASLLGVMSDVSC